MNVFSRDKYRDETTGLKARLVNLPASVRWGALAVALLSLVFIGWLALQGLAAKSNLEQAKTSALQTKDALLNGSSEDAVRGAQNAQFHARQARAATHSLPWNIAAALPVLGSPLKTTQQIADVVVGLADDVLFPSAAMGDAVTPDKLIDGTRLNLDLLRAEQPRLTELAAAAAELDSEAQAIQKPAFLSLISDARSQLQDQTAQLAQLLGNTSIAAQLAPSMLGADGPRTYLMGFQTPAEARGTGGLLGGFGVLRFIDGEAKVDTLGSNTELAGDVADINLGPEFDKVYGFANPYTDFRNSNLSAHFPYAAQIWQSMWEKQSGMKTDGVIAIDPTVLSYLLGALGPVALPDGEKITAENVVELTMSTAYARFPPEFKVFGNGDRLALPDRRKQYLQSIAQEVAKKLSGPVNSPRKLLDALGRAASEGRISVWSSSATEQRVLEMTPLAGIIPDDAAPYAGVVINNLAGNKMDYYLRREIEYVADGCTGDVRNSTVTVRLANTAPNAPLPESVAGTTGLVEGLPVTFPSGTMVSSVRVLGTAGATLMSVTSNGERTSATVGTERGHPSFEVQVAIPPGKSGELTFRLREPTAPGEARVPVQPLIDTVTPAVSVPTCH